MNASKFIQGIAEGYDGYIESDGLKCANCIHNHKGYILCIEENCLCEKDEREYMYEYERSDYSLGHKLIKADSEEKADAKFARLRNRLDVAKLISVENA